MIRRILATIAVFVITWTGFFLLSPPLALYLGFLSKNYGANTCMGGLCLNVLIARDWNFYMGFFVAVVIALILNLFAGAQSQESDTYQAGVFDFGETF